MRRACCDCEHYNQRSYLCTTGQKDVSGGIVWYRQWAKHRCDLKQEHLYPRHCDFKGTPKYVAGAAAFKKEMELIVAI